MKSIAQFKNILKTLMVAAVCFLLTPDVVAQSPAETVYVQVESMKVEPGMEADYLKVEEVWKKVHQRRAAEGKILFWGLVRLLYPSGTDAKYDYETVTVYKSGKDLEDAKNMTWDYITKGMSKEDLAIAEKTEKTRKLVSRVLFMELARGKPGGRFGKFTHVKVAAGKEDETSNIVKMMTPVSDEAVKMGKTASYVLGRRLYPLSAEGATHYRIIFFNTIEDLVKSETNGYLFEAFKKAYPNKDFGAAMKSISDVSKDLDSEIFEHLISTN